MRPHRRHRGADEIPVRWQGDRYWWRQHGATRGHTLLQFCRMQRTFPGPVLVTTGSICNICMPADHVPDSCMSMGTVRSMGLCNSFYTESTWS